MTAAGLASVEGQTDNDGRVVFENVPLGEGSLDETVPPQFNWVEVYCAIADDVATQPLLTPRDLRAVEAPTLIACGDRDPLVPVGQAWALSRAVRDGRLLVAPGSGHDVVHERADLVGAAMTAFYRSTEPIARERARTALLEVPR